MCRSQKAIGPNILTLLFKPRNGTPATELPVVGATVRSVWGLGFCSSLHAKTEPPMLKFSKRVFCSLPSGLQLTNHDVALPSCIETKPLRVPLKIPPA